MIGNSFQVGSAPVTIASNPTYSVGDTVSYNCVPNHYFPDDSSTWSINCELPGNWTEIPSKCTGMLLSKYHVVGDFCLTHTYMHASVAGLCYIVQISMPPSFVLSGIRTHNLLIFGQTPRSSCLGGRQEDSCLPKVLI